MGRKRILPMLSFHGQGLLLLAAVSSPHCKSVRRSCAPSFSAHVRLGEHGAPVQGRGLQSSLPTTATPTNSAKVGTQPGFAKPVCSCSSSNKINPTESNNSLIWTAERHPSLRDWIFVTVVLTQSL